MPAVDSPAVQERFELFAQHYVSNGGNGTQAARSAGYQGSDETMRSTAYRLIRRPDVIARVHELTKEFFTEDAVKARSTMLKLLDAKSELVRFNAAKDIMDRAGHRPLETLLHMNQSSSLTEDELRDKISALFDKLKVIDEKPVPPHGKVEEGLVPVDPESPPLEGGSGEGQGGE